MSDPREPRTCAADETAKLNELATSLLETTIRLVEPILAPMCLSIIVAYVRGQIGVGLVEVQPHEETGIRISGKGPEEFIAQDDRGRLCVFYEGCDVVLTARGSLLLVTYDSDGSDGWTADARVVTAAETVVMFGRDAARRMVLEIAGVAQRHAAVRRARGHRESLRARGMASLAALIEEGGEDVSPDELRAFVFLAGMLDQASGIQRLPVPVPSSGSDKENRWVACNVAVPKTASVLDADA
jgi:hypothetical protein